MKKITEMKDVLILQLQTLYDIESEVEKNLPKFAKASTDVDLSGAFQEHLEETKEQIKRLEQIFEMIGQPLGKNKSESIRGSAEDFAAILKINSSTHLKDVLIANCARSVEHNEIANYLSAIQEAHTLGLTDEEELLKQSCKEEKEADDKLKELIKSNFKE